MAVALSLPETRPRFDEVTQGTLINLRGLNLNPGACPEDMVVLRIPATDRQRITQRKRRIKEERFIGPQRKDLEDWANAKSGLLDATTAPHLAETANRAARTAEALEAARNRLGVLQDHPDAKAAATLGLRRAVPCLVYAGERAIYIPQSIEVVMT